MPRFRKKPVEIEARRVPVWGETDDVTSYLEESIALADWANGKSHMMVNEDEYAFDGAIVTGPYIAIHTLEGVMAALPGDYIIQGVQGEFYPCKPDIFEATYDPID